MLIYVKFSSQPSVFCCQVEELDASVRKLMREKEELRQVLEEQEEQASITLQEETHKLRVQNQELQHKVSKTEFIQTVTVTVW